MNYKDFITQAIEASLTIKNITGDYTFTCQVSEANYGYRISYKTKIDGKTFAGVVPVTVDLAESLKLPIEDFELTVAA